MPRKRVALQIELPMDDTYYYGQVIVRCPSEGRYDVIKCLWTVNRFAGGARCFIS